jgi:small subunit ribosomal protein S3
VPLQTLRIPIDYGFFEARTVYGIIGIKCWVNRKPEIEGQEPQPRRSAPRRDRGERSDRGGGDRGPRGDSRENASPPAAAPAPQPAPAPAV